jgi:succinyl-diaminopimelate desuccinylase
MNTKGIIILAKKLISCKTVNDQKEFDKCFKIIEEFFDSPKFKIKKFVFNGKKSLIISNQETKQPKVMFYGHIDVVSAPDKMFKPKISSGKLCGRGASDMKGVLAAEMVLMKNLVLSGFSESIALLVVSDEEVGGFDGAKMIIEKEGYRPSVVVIPDGGDNWRMVDAEKGVYWLEITAKGKTAHGSRPWLGDNAGEKLMEKYFEIKRQFKLAKNEKDVLPTINLGKMEGGLSLNQVMGEAKIYLDIRYPSPFTEKMIKEKIKKILGADFEIRGLETALPANNPINKYSKFLKEILIEQNGIQPEEIISCGASDARFFRYKKIPALVFKPVCGDQHGDAEWINIKSLSEFYEVCGRLVEMVAK